MEVQDKPNQADPAASEAGEESLSKDAVIAQRVAEAMSVKQAASEDAPSMEPSQPATGGSGSDVPSHQDSVSAADPKSEALKLIEASTGREFSSEDEARKYLSNLNSLVGDQSVAKARDAAKKYEALMAKFAEQSGQSVEEVSKFWADQVVQAAPAQEAPKKSGKDKLGDEVREEISRLTKELNQLKEVTQKEALLAKYPYAANVAEEVAIIARQKGQDMLSVFENSPFKGLLEERAKAESGKNPIVTPANRVSYDKKRVQEKAARVLSPTGGDEDKIALVKEFGKTVGL